MKKNFKLLMVLGVLLGVLGLIQFTTFAEESIPKKEATKDIVDIASEDARFKTLVTALKAAGIVDDLKGVGPFTVFAPTDEAFAKVPKETLENLLKPENKDVLAGILAYHLSPGKLTAKDVVKFNGRELKMGNGQGAKVEVKGNDVYIDGAKIVVTDIMAKNGVIHVIDAVMMP